MNSPLVSVIIPAYNGARTIRETIESVLGQTYSPFETIVVDDGSTDATPEIVAAFGPQVRLIRRDRNSGICDRARCDGIQQAKGKYCAFIDQDDLWFPDKLAKQVAFMESHPQIPMSHHYVRVIDEDGRPLEIRHEGKIPPTGNCARSLLEHCFITISSIMVRPEVWLDAQRAHGMRFPNSDLETFFYILRSFPAGIGFIPEVLGFYRRWTQSMSRQNWRWTPEDVDELERVYTTRVWEGLLDEREVRRALARAYAVNAEYHRHQGRPGRALYFARRGLRYAPLNYELHRSVLLSCARGLAGQGFSTH
ncbi:MAG: glycosyltransferase [Kiritimatiellae bacterium]|nr:glycosyltransferase [Kiritimatiellia bacterium]MDW8459535.1 glycosyltransferase [Verrucomicrobiota bacterium]